MAPLLSLAGAPRIVPSARRRTKPQTPCTQRLRSASLSYRPTLSGTAFCNPIPPAHSCRHVRPLIPLTSLPTIVRAAPSISALSLNPVTFYYKRIKIILNTCNSRSDKGLADENGKDSGSGAVRNPGSFYAPALVLQDFAYSYRMWITLIKLSYTPLQHPQTNLDIHPAE